MSIRRTMKQATLEICKAEMGWLAGQVAIVRRGGKPRPDCGEWFLGIWAGTREWGMTTASYPRMSVQLTLTLKISGPIDRYDVALDEEEDGFDDHMDQLAGFLFANQNKIRERADQLMPAGCTGFVCAPRPINDPEPETVGPQWFDGAPANHRIPGGIGDGDICGFRSTLIYGGWTFQHPWDTDSL